MLRDVVGDGGFSTNAIVGLVVFFLVFLGVVVWVLTRRKRTIDRWSKLPLDGDSTTPREPRTPPGSDDHQARTDNQRDPAHGRTKR